MTQIKIAFTFIIFIVTGGALFSTRFAKFRFIAALSWVFALLSGVYLIREIVHPGDIFPSSFDSEICLKDAEKNRNTFMLRTKHGFIKVKNFRSNSEVIGHNEYSTLDINDNALFEIFFSQSTAKFGIVLNLIASDITPETAINSAATYLQNELCLKKSQICDLNYSISAPRASNVNYPELQGVNMSFNFCKK